MNLYGMIYIVSFPSIEFGHNLRPRSTSGTNVDYGSIAETVLGAAKQSRIGMTLQIQLPWDILGAYVLCLTRLTSFVRWARHGGPVGDPVGDSFCNRDHQQEVIPSLCSDDSNQREIDAGIRIGRLNFAKSLKTRSNGPPLP